MMEENILLGVRRPAQYVGEEWNVSRKSFDSARVSFALCFPDLYEVGMSNLGIRILYAIANNLEGVVCERFFSPGTDLEALMRSQGLKPLSLESGKQLKDFDIIGFSLAHELNYTNMLNLLAMGGIPLQAEERDPSMPLVIAGGPSVVNPEPLHAFCDLFVIGEAEEAIVEILRLYEECKEQFRSSRLSKLELLRRFSRIRGVYAPSLYEVCYHDDGTIASFTPRGQDIPPRIEKRILQDLNSGAFPTHWLVPYIQIIHDRITLEIMRGCPNKCRFCQARVQYYPFRQRKVEEAIRLAQESCRQSGYEEISLCGLSVSEYYAIGELIETLITSFKAKAVSVSLPSIKPKIILEHLSSLIASIKKTGLTFAPEAASQRLRAVLAKTFDIEEFKSVLRKAYEAGYQRVKLYFMIGLPGETASDLEEIVTFARGVSELRRQAGGHAADVSISINTLIPKPHTPFQWLAMEAMEEVALKETLIRSKLSGSAGGGKSKKLKVDFHHKEMAFLEAVFSRGDRRLSKVILSAFYAGARFDSWSEHFKFWLWQEAFVACAIDPNFYLRPRKHDEILPWDFIDMGVRKEYLLQEAKDAMAG